MENKRLPVSTRVRVREDCQKAHLRGLAGTVMAAYHSSGRHAVHVRLDDGRWQLFWLGDLEEETAASEYR
jgi:hypothetical protein